VDICPVGAAQMEEGSVSIDKSLCIHCMCCHEVCRFQAVKLKQRTVGKLVDGLSALYGKITSLLT
jgi:Fe-S-cluster-containing hydrogenase component 2